MIRLQDVTKRYGQLTAVDGVTLAVHRGELFGFLGPNGAGKTTTIKMCTGLLRPTSGHIWIGQYDVVANPLAAKAIVGYVPDQPILYEKLTGSEFLDFMGGLWGMPPAERQRKAKELLELFDLAGASADLCEGYSHGMKQKLALAGALIHDPQVLFLDEPTVGLDPRSARLIKDLLRGLCQRGVTVFMSTHIMEIAERMCDRVAIIDHGRIVAIGTVDELRQNGGPGQSLEDIFLQLTGGEEDQELIAYLGERPDEGGRQ